MLVRARCHSCGGWIPLDSRRRGVLIFADGKIPGWVPEDVRQAIVGKGDAFCTCTAYERQKKRRLVEQKEVEALRSTLLDIARQYPED